MNIVLALENGYISFRINTHTHTHTHLEYRCVDVFGPCHYNIQKYTAFQTGWDRQEKKLLYHHQDQKHIQHWHTHTLWILYRAEAGLLSVRVYLHTHMYTCVYNTFMIQSWNNALLCKETLLSVWLYIYIYVVISSCLSSELCKADTM